MEPTVRLSDDGTASVPGPLLGTVLLRALLAAGVAASAATASWWPFWTTETATGVVNLMVAVTFAATAAVLYEDRAQRSTAAAIALAAAFYLTSWWWAWPSAWQVGPLALISFVLGYLWFLFGGLALTRYPDVRLRHWYERAFFVALALWICGVKLVLVALSEPGWAQFGSNAWWFPLAPDRAVYDQLTTVFNSGLVVFILGLLILLVVKIRRLRGLELLDAAPAVVAAAVVAVSGALYLGARVLGQPTGVQDQFRIVTAVAALATPVAFLTAVVRRHMTRSAALVALPRIYYAPAPADVRTELRRALRDPDLQLWQWCGDSYVDADGTAADPVVRDDRWLVSIRSSDDDPLAVIGVKASLLHHRSLVESAAHAVGMTLERQRAFEEMHASRARINEAELAARRTIARDLHDGAQQMLLTARLRLAMATRRAANDPATRKAIDQAGEQVDTALTVIRQLADGNDPSLLSEGLAVALPEMVRDIGIPVQVDVTAGPLPPAIERNLWFLIAEAITNVRRHAKATSAVVTIERDGTEVVVTITDDGCGGADATAGSGLAGMIDRVHALRGRIRIDSPPDRGTVIEARLPCE